MGEIADYLIDQMVDESRSPFSDRGFACRRGRKSKPKKKVDSKAFDEETRAREYTGKNTPAALVPDFPEKTFDMSFFPKTPVPRPEPSVWDLDQDDAPF